MKQILLHLLLPALICLAGCTKEKDREADQLMDSKYVMTLTPVQLSNDAFNVTGEIINAENRPITEYGFVYSFDGSGPLVSSGSKIVVGDIRNGSLISSGQFTAVWDVSVPESHYALRAYAVIGGQTYYGKTFRYTSPPRGIWKRLSDFPGSRRSFAFSFAVNGKGYVCGGWTDSVPLNDCWEYDPAGDSWTRIGDFPGWARSGGFCFVIGNTAYLGGGTSAQPNLPNSTAYRDFYSFDAATQTWKQLANIPTDLANEGIYGTYHFAWNGYGFVGGGRIGYQQIGYGITRYDPATNTWEAYSASPKNYQDIYYPMFHSAGFVINDTLFVGTGLSGTFASTPTDDFFRFTIPTKEWNYYGPAFGGASAYNFGTVVNGFGYLGFGGTGNVLQYQYNETGSPWKQTTFNPDHYVEYAPVSFTINNKIYVGLGTGFDFFNKSSFYQFTPR